MGLELVGEDRRGVVKQLLVTRLARRPALVEPAPHPLVKLATWFALAAGRQHAAREKLLTRILRDGPHVPGRHFFRIARARIPEIQIQHLDEQGCVDLIPRMVIRL